MEDFSAYTLMLDVGWISLLMVIGNVLRHKIKFVFQDLLLPAPITAGLLGLILLAFAVPPHADPLDLLAPRAPMVAAHPAPLTGPGEVTLRFGTSAAGGSVPMLSALPALRPA